MVTTVLELAGLATVTAGVLLVSVPAGLIVGGLMLFAVGVAAAGEQR